MTPEEVLEKLDLLSEAPYGIPKLRELVLGLAFSGQLSGSTRGNGGIPDHWRLVPLSELEPEFQNGIASRGDKGGVPVIVLRLADVVRRQISLRSTRVLSILPKQKQRFSVRKGDILITRVNGSADIVGTFILARKDLDVIYCDHFIRMRISSELVEPQYLAFLGESPRVRDQIKRLFVTTAGQKTVNQGHVRSLTVPIPPLAEQKRIVAKVDELMALCDRLEAQQQERKTRHVALARASLARFADAPTPANLGFLFHKSYDVSPADLRKSILSLAVRGKLVAQDPNDEPVDDWLQTIPHLKADNETRESPYLVPDGWTWLRVASVFEVAGGIQKTPHRTPNEYAFPYLGVRNVYRGRLDLTNIKEFELRPNELERRRLKYGDLLIVEGNGSFNEIGRCAKWNGEIKNCVHQNHVIRCRPCDGQISDFVLLFLNSPNGMEIMQRLAITSSGLYSLSVGKIRKIEIPLPPLAEQGRIVARVNQLMALVDELESQLAASRTTAKDLLEAVVADLAA